MSTIAGAVMFVLLLAATAAVLGGVELLSGQPGTREVALVPAIALWMLALVALGTIGVIAAILATIPRPPPPPPMNLHARRRVTEPEADPIESAPAGSTAG